MARKVITFDFHNTLVQCDEWFELEVRALPAEFARWHAAEIGPLAHGSDPTAFDGAYRQLRRSIMEHGHELSAERSLALIYGQAGVHVLDEVLARGVGELMTAALAHATAIPGAIESVRALAARGIPLGVVSSAVYHPFLEWSLERLGMRDAFEIVVTSASCGYYKSRPEIYLHTLDALAADPSSSVHIGDSIRFDVAGAQRAGMRTVWLDHAGVGNLEHTPDLTITTLEDASADIVELFDLI